MLKFLLQKGVAPRLLIAASIQLNLAGAEFPEFQVESAREYLSALGAMPAEAELRPQEVLYLQAQVQSRLGQHDTAERLAKEALSREPESARLQLFLGTILMRRDRLEEAAVHLRQAVRLDPKIESGWRRLGMVADHLGDRAEARACFEKALVLNPADTDARLLMGNLLIDGGQFEKAIFHLERAAQDQPESSSAWYVLAQAQLGMEDREAASRSMKTFQQLKQKERDSIAGEDAAPSDAAGIRRIVAGFHIELAALCLRRGFGTEAESHLKQAARIAPEDTAAHEMLASYYLEKRRPAAARPHLEELVALRPNNPDDHLNLGTVLFQLEMHRAAVSEFRRALELNPKLAEAHNNLARYYLGTRQNFAEALQHGQRLVEIESSGANYDLLAWAYYANGQTKQALEASKRSVELEPENVPYQRRYQQLRQMQ